MTDSELAGDLASYFVRITDKFSPLDALKTPVTFTAPFTPLLPHEIAKKIKEAKKAKSAVEGDILPVISSRFSDITAIPTTRIVNFSLHQLKWPSPWLIETQSAIPKSDNTTTYDHLCNLSCTNELSKLLESIVLEKIRK